MHFSSRTEKTFIYNRNVRHNANETENTKKFIEWILSKEGQYLIEKTGYFPLR